MKLFFIRVLVLLAFVPLLRAMAPCKEIGEAPIGTIPFITTWKTDNPGTSDPNQITIPASGTNYTVDWGDGTITTETNEATHTYTAIGTYTISITGPLEAIVFDNGGDKDKLMTIEQWGNTKWTQMRRAYRGCSNLNITNPSIDTPDLSLIDDLYGTFDGAINFNGDISDWDVSNVTRTDYLFLGAIAFNQNIGNWNTSSMTKMSSMFEDAHAFNQDIGNWDTSNVTDMRFMFRHAHAFNQDIGYWNTSQVLKITNMFAYTESFNQNIDFKPGAGIPTGDAWNTSQVTDMSGVFWNAEVFNSQIGNWDTSNVTTFSLSFAGAEVFNQDISEWVTASVVRAGQMFSGATNFNQDIGDWDTSNMTDMVNMFYNANSFNQDLGAWDVSNVTDVDSMFFGVTLSTANYDALLIGWNALNLQPNLRFNGGNSQYCAGEVARENMRSSDGWTISDDGPTGTIVSDLPNQSHVNNYTLPNITGSRLTGREAYYTEPNGNGTSYSIGSVLNFGDFPSYPVTLYIYDGSGSCASEESFLLTLTETPTVPSSCTNLTSPLDNGTDVDITTDLTWAADSNATGYILRVGTALGSSDLLDITLGTVNTYNLPDALPAGAEIFVRIVPFNDSGNASGCVSENFTTLELPDCTNLTTPLDAATDVSIATDLSWATNLDATGYILRVGTTLGSFDLLNETLGAVNTYDLTSDLPPSAEIFVRIIPFNESGNALGCVSESFTTETLASIPNCTNLTSPLNGATNVAIDITEISWDVVTDATGYTVSVDGSSSNVNDITNQVITGTSFSLPGNFDNAETVSVTIVPFNSEGDALGCTAQSFTTAPDTASEPSCTMQTYPIVGSSTTQRDDSLLTWEDVPNATGYRLDITVSEGTNNITQTVPTNTYNFPNFFEYGETVNVTIIPFNGEGEAIGCSSRSYTIAEEITDVPQHCAELESPLNGATNVAIDITEISWDAVVDATGYTVSVNGSSSDVNDITNQDFTTNSYALSGNFDSGETVTVTIIPFNSEGNALGCAAQTFTIAAANVTTLPACTELISPANESLAVSTTTAISWNTIAMVDGYVLSVRTDSDEIIFPETDMGVLTSYTLSENLPFATTIIVNIRPYNSAGQNTSCSEQYFTTEEAPEPITPEEPINPTEPETVDNTKYGFSPNGDGMNDFWKIDDIEAHPENVVSVYNRWGDMVFQMQGYDNNTKLFHGKANKKNSMGADDLPSGTYFFNIEVTAPHNFEKLQGYLVIKR